MRRGVVVALTSDYHLGSGSRGDIVIIRDRVVSTVRKRCGAVLYYDVGSCRLHGRTGVGIRTVDGDSQTCRALRFDGERRGGGALEVDLTSNFHVICACGSRRNSCPLLLIADGIVCVLNKNLVASTKGYGHCWLRSKRITRIGLISDGA